MNQHDDDTEFVEDEGLEVRAFIAGEREDVWQHWVDVALLETWWWPMFDDTRYEVDAQPGGVYRFHTGEGGIGVSGEFEDVEPQERLAFSWHWTGQDAESTVVVTFRDADDGTLVTVAHTNIPFDDVDPLTEGWEDVLTRLEERFDDLNG